MTDTAIIQMHSGNYIDLANPGIQDIHIEDIAASLSKLCRFTGHTKGFYSVAQHSVMCAFHGRSDRRMFSLLLHDAHEAYVGDMNSPLKALCPDFRRLEAGIDLIIRARFGLAWEMTAYEKEVDLRMLATEVKQLLTDPNPGWPCLRKAKPYRTVLKPWGPAQAEDMFMEHFNELAPAQEQAA